MRARKVLVGVVSTVIVAGALSLAAAPAASAADIALTISCEAGNPKNVATEVVAQPGDTIFVSGPNCVVGSVDPAFYTLFQAWGGSDGTFSFLVAPRPLGTYGSSEVPVFAVDNDREPGGDTICDGDLGDTTCGAAFYLTLGDGSAATTTDSTPIPAWVQAYGRANADAQCLDGWDASWAEWPNGGKGGFVCTRSIPSLG